MLPLDAQAMLRSVLSCSASGSPETASRQVAGFIERYKPDELIVTAQIYDQQARLRSYDLLMDAVRQPRSAAA
jgi:alkanesulfonate monooxygenase SsuD/methylene tetrahydromethanopterin reductase-like flavin-dependent oxidoreductase (luciferase family)